MQKVQGRFCLCLKIRRKMQFLREFVLNKYKKMLFFIQIHVWGILSLEVFIFWTSTPK